jgi:aspergillopepsin I
MVSDGLIPNLFSLAIERDISGPSGYLAFGGLPPVSFDGPFTSTPNLVTKFLTFPVTYLFYTINIDSVLHGKPVSGSGGPGVQYIISTTTPQL